MRTCRFCDGPLGLGGARGRVPVYCSSRCRVGAHRARRALPAELTEGRRWVRADGKRPIQRDGRPASSTNPGTWSDYREVVAGGAGDGFGVMLGGGLGCYDLDGVEDSEVVRFLGRLVEPVLWVERSISGRGVHIFVAAAEGPGWRRGRVERYSRARFIRVTGERFVAVGRSRR